MPTENRSSNTEMAAQLSPCPHCGQQDAFVEQLDSDASVVICQGRIDGHSACLARGPVGVQQHECEDQPGHDQAVKEWNKRAAAAPHPDPIAWMVGTAFWWTKEQAERDAAETGLPIVGLGHMAGVAPAERQLGEPVCLDGATFMGKPSFQHSIEWYREGISKHWKKICDLRAEVERLRKEHTEAVNVGMRYQDQCNALRAQLAEAHALLRDIDDWMDREDRTPGFEIEKRMADVFRFASAEPSAPIAWHVGGNGYNRICFEEPTDLPGHPCIQAIHDQRLLIELLKRYDLRDENAPPDERAHGIPGTSFQRLNALANQGE